MSSSPELRPVPAKTRKKKQVAVWRPTVPHVQIQVPPKVPRKICLFLNPEDKAALRIEQIPPSLHNRIMNSMSSTPTLSVPPKESCPLLSLPPELHLQIGQHLAAEQHFKSLFAFHKTCRSLRETLRGLLISQTVATAHTLYEGPSYTAVVNHLLSLGVRVKIANTVTEGITAKGTPFTNSFLMIATMVENFGAVKLLVRAGADVNIGYLGNDGGFATPLFAGVQRGDCKTVRYLLRHGADIARGSSSISCLDWARRQGSEYSDVVRVLVMHGALQTINQLSPVQSTQHASYLNSPPASPLRSAGAVGYGKTTQSSQPFSHHKQLSQDSSDSFGTEQVIGVEKKEKKEKKKVRFADDI